MKKVKKSKNNSAESIWENYEAPIIPINEEAIHGETIHREAEEELKRNSAAYGIGSTGGFTSGAMSFANMGSGLGGIGAGALIGAAVTDPSRHSFTIQSRNNQELLNDAIEKLEIASRNRALNIQSQMMAQELAPGNNNLLARKYNSLMNSLKNYNEKE